MEENERCENHWHCDPKIAAHDCEDSDRTRPCPGCGHAPKKFRDGQRVILRSYPVGHDEFPEGLPEERGVVLGGDVPGHKDWSTMYTISVDEEYISCGPYGHDDGLRELSEDQIVPVDLETERCMDCGNEIVWDQGENHDRMNCLTCKWSYG